LIPDATDEEVLELETVIVTGTERSLLETQAHGDLIRDATDSLRR
jgi:hypothetical protein